MIYCINQALLYDMIALIKKVNNGSFLGEPDIPISGSLVDIASYIGNDTFIVILVRSQTLMRQKHALEPNQYNYILE